MAEEGDVQAYLTRHKISTLFEELMAKVVKEMPSDPIDFLIKKLQSLQQHRLKKKDSPHTPAISSVKTSRGKIQVTGTSLASKIPTTKSPISDRLNKSTSGLRPVKARTALSSSSTHSLPSKTTPTKTTPSRPTTASRAAGGATASSGGVAKSSPIKLHAKTRPSATLTAATTTPPAHATASSRLPSRRTPLRPSTAPAVGGAVKTMSPRAAARGGKTPVAKIPVATASGTSVKKQRATAPSSSIPSDSRPPPIPSSVTFVKATRKDGYKEEEEINEFFGGAKKSSQRQFLVVDSEEDEGADVGGMDSEGDENYEGAGQGDSPHESLGIDIQRIMEKKRCKHIKKSRHANLKPLVSPPTTTPLSLGYDDEDDTPDSADSDTVIEDPDSLRDEGVELNTKSHTLIKSSSTLPVRQEVVVCARCAAVLGKGEEVVLPDGLEFDSASQVFSHVSYPQWGSEDLGSSSAGQLCSPRMSERDHETASDITLQSHDTWGGLAPPAPPQPPTSDEESEVQLPPPALKGQSWMPPAPPRENPHGWGQAT